MAKIRKFEKKLNEAGQKIANKEVELLNLHIKSEEIIKNLQEDVMFFKKKLQDMQKLYFEEQELWKKQWMNVNRRSIGKPLVLLHSSYNLAVTRLKDDLYKTPTPIEPGFPDDIKKAKKSTRVEKETSLLSAK